MWAHYTGENKGICVEYEPDLFDFLKKYPRVIAYGSVKYSNKPPTVKGLEDYESKAKKMLFNKYMEWKYEKEYRVVFRSDKDTEFIPIDKKFIKSVYIGSRTTPKIIDKIRSICSNTHIDIYYGIALGKSYEICFKKHEDGVSFPRSFYE